MRNKFLLFFSMFFAFFVSVLCLKTHAGNGFSTDMLWFKPGSSLVCPSGKACLYSKSADNQLYSKNANGVEFKLHTALGFRTSSDCTSLASPVAGDVCYDTTLNTLMYYNGSWKTNLSNDRTLTCTDITGCGALSSNLTLSLSTTGVSAGSCTNCNLTIDSKGRISAQSSSSFYTPIAGSGLTGQPTALGVQYFDALHGTILVSSASDAKYIIIPTGTTRIGDFRVATSTALVSGEAMTISIKASTTFQGSLSNLSTPLSVSLASGEQEKSSPYSSTLSTEKYLTVQINNTGSSNFAGTVFVWIGAK